MKYLTAIATALLVSTPASAAQIVLGASNIVGGTALGSNFALKNIFNQQTGAIPVEGFIDGSYWLSQDNDGAKGVFTIDLGDAFSGLTFDFFNTSNGGLNDRGVGNFEILASNELAPDGTDGSTLGGDITKILDGTLLAESDGLIEAQTRSANNTTAYRYIQFRAKSVAAGSDLPHGPQSYGLNELRVFTNPVTAVPEPATWAMMITGFGFVGSSMRRRAGTPATLAAR